VLTKKDWVESEGIKLKNDGKLSLFFLGVGSAFTKVNFQNNLLIIKGDDHLMIDCGTLGPLSLHQFGMSVMDIDNFLITHSHADHIGGMEEVILMDRYVKGKKPNIIINRAYKKSLWRDSLRGGSAYGENRHGGMKFEDYFNPLMVSRVKDAPRETWEYTLGSMNLKIFRTNHIPDAAPTWKEAHLSYGVLIDDRILFSSDTKFDKELLTSFNERYPIEYIFHDCQLYTGGVHASFQELSTLSNEIRNKMILCHFGDNYKDFDPQSRGFIEFAQRGKYYYFD